MMSVGLIFDIAAALVVAFFAVRGLLRGFSGEVLGLVGFFASVFCAWTFARPAADLLLKYFSSVKDPSLVALGCGVLIFIAVSLLFALLDGMLSLIVKAANLSALDHLLGVVMGSVKALCFVLVIYAVFVTLPVLPKDWMAGSYAMKGASAVWPPVQSFLESHGLLDLKALSGLHSGLPTGGIAQ